MTLEDELFRKRIPIPKKLLKYGFKQIDETHYTYSTPFMNDDFYAVITINDDHVIGKVYDAFSDEEYTLVHMPKVGAYGASVKEAYVQILEDIARKCFRTSYFTSHQARRIAQLIRKIYKIEPSFPYKGKRQDDAVFKSSKIFAIISQTDAFTKSEEEILNVKVSDDLYPQLLQKEGIYPTHLRNRKNWISIPLNDVIDDDILLELIRYSYTILNERRRDGIKEWIIPSSSDFDIDDYFSQDQVFWRQTTDIHVDDIIYVYVSRPYSCILYKCVATQVNLNNPYESAGKRKHRAMLMHPLERYDPHDFPLSLMKKFNVRYVRGPRFMPKELSDYINYGNGD